MEKIGKYTILSKLGEGGMGIVYKAMDSVIERVVAIKTMSARLDPDPVLRERFFREARSAAQLSHKNIITIYNFGEEGDQIYLAMEYLEGEDLKEKIVNRAPMSMEEKLQIMVQVCEGLSHAHDKQVIHRDIKPGNIFVTLSGQVKILDFGLAHYVSSEITKAGSQIGTLSYSPPEMVRGDAVDNRSDIFSAGVVFYELLTYRKPFSGDSYPAILFKILQSDPEPPSNLDPTVPSELSTIVLRAMAKQPEQRYQHADEMLKDLGDFRKDLFDQKQPLLDEVVQIYERISNLLEQNPQLLRGEAEQFETLIQSDPFSSCLMTGEQETGSGKERALYALGHLQVSEVRDRLVEEEKALILLLPERKKSFSLLVEAIALDKSGKIEGALQILEKILAADPEFINAELLRQKVSAKLETQKAQQEKARQAEDLFQKAVMRFESNDLAGCQDLLERALSVQSEHSSALSLLAQVQQKIKENAELEEKQRQTQETVAAARKALEAGNYKLARNKIESALTLMPEEPDALQILKKIELLEEEERAREEKERKVRELFKEARELAGVGEDERALVCLNDLLAMGTDHPSALSLKKEISDRIEEKKIRERKAIEVKDLLQKAEASLSVNDLPGCRSFLKDALTLQPGHLEANLLLNRVKLMIREQAELEEKRRQAGQAITAARRAQASGDFKRARDEWDRAITAFPSTPGAAEVLREIERAEAEQKARAEQDQKVAELLGDANRLEDLAEHEKALTVLDQLLAIEPTHPSALARKRDIEHRLAQERAEQEKQARIIMFLRQARDAEKIGDLASAAESAHSILAEDKTHPEGRQILERVEARIREIEENEKARQSVQQPSVPPADFAGQSSDRVSTSAEQDKSVRSTEEIPALPDLKLIRPEEQIKPASAAELEEAKHFKEPIKAALSPVKKILIALAAIIVIVTCIGIARVFFSPPVLQIIQVDASPWAKVTVFSEENKVILPENETPFQAQLSPGTYIFRFAYGAERRDIPVTVTRKSMDAIRCDFWTEEQWRALLPTFK